jgi:chorismate mutase
MKLLLTLITQNTSNQEDMKSIIKSMKPEIASMFSAALQQEVSTLLENLGGMTQIIEANFSQIKDIFQTQKEDIIKTLT